MPGCTNEAQGGKDIVVSGVIRANETSHKAFKDKFSLPFPLLVDTDGDGLPDGHEKAWGTDPLKPDTDGDGVRD